MDRKPTDAGSGASAETAAFWSAIAGSPEHGPAQRRNAIVQLFRRHVHPGMTLAELAHVLGRQVWLRAEDVAEVSALGGKIPVRATSGDTLFVLELLPGLDDEVWAIYLRVGGEVSREDFLDAILARRPDPPAGGARIREIGFHTGP